MGEPVNLREQHDALEFFNSVVDSLDEALKAVGANAVFLKCLGGSYADQKICKGCPHRWVVYAILVGKVSFRHTLPPPFLIIFVSKDASYRNSSFRCNHDVTDVLTWLWFVVSGKQTMCAAM